jgi:serine/threonine protein kinase
MRVGDTLAGKYRLDRLIGSGATSVVFAAWHLERGALVAIKGLLPHVLEDETARGRFFREAEAAASIDSEHVARVYELGFSEDRVPFLAMEYLEGEDLAQLLAKYGPPPLQQAIEIAIQVCEALAHGHARGIVHRDLKPANLFCTRGVEGAPHVKLLDFGASRLLAPLGPDTDSAPLSRAGVPIGSPLYMAPEQIHATDAVDTRADIWALGVILYELLTGRTPFMGNEVGDLMMKIMMSSPVPPSQLQPGLPARLEQVVLRCLEKEPLLRFRNVGEVAIALAEFAPRRSQPCVDRIARRVASVHTLDLTAEEAPLRDRAPLTPPPLAPPASSPPPVVVTQTLPSTSPRRLAKTQPMPSSSPPPRIAATQGMPASSPPPRIAATQGMPSWSPPPRIAATQGMPSTKRAPRAPRRWQRDVALALLIGGGLALLGGAVVALWWLLL